MNRAIIRWALRLLPVYATLAFLFAVLCGAFGQDTPVIGPVGSYQIVANGGEPVAWIIDTRDGSVWLCVPTRDCILQRLVTPLPAAGQR